MVQWRTGYTHAVFEKRCRINQAPVKKRNFTKAMKKPREPVRGFIFIEKRALLLPDGYDKDF